MLTASPFPATAITTRPANEQDLPLLFDLFKTTRAWELSFVEWDEAQKEAFLQQQFNAQRTQYAQNFPTGEHNIIMADGSPIGRIYTARLEAELHLLDILLDPEIRNQGIGSFFMNQLKEQAQLANLPLRFYVWQLNHAAQRFYQRHDCRVIEEVGAYIHMEWVAR